MNDFRAQPWTVETDPIEARLKAIKAKFEYEPREWASVWVAREVAVDQADLLAAAPELLAALKGLLDTACPNLDVYEECGCGADPCPFHEAEEMAKRAVAKAEGRTI